MTHLGAELKHGACRAGFSLNDKAKHLVMSKPHLLWQVSILNFLHYNVKGGGDSALYGVEPATFYLRNGLNNLNLVLPLALAYPVVAVLHLLRVTGEHVTVIPAKPAQLDADDPGCAPALLQRLRVTGGSPSTRLARPKYGTTFGFYLPLTGALHLLPFTGEVWPAQTELGAVSPCACSISWPSCMAYPALVQQ